jgi:hypothetical protein
MIKYSFQNKTRGLKFIREKLNEQYLKLHTTKVCNFFLSLHTPIKNVKILSQNSNHKSKTLNSSLQNRCNLIYALLNCACHCNCFFKRKTSSALKCAKNLCFKRCNCRFYSFRRSGAHPPKILFT